MILVGVELEMNNYQANLDLAYWHRDNDSSINHDEKANPGELKFTGAFDAWRTYLALEEIRKQRSATWSVNSSCGFHVHLDTNTMRSSSLKFIRVWEVLEPFIMQLVPPSRRNNYYCRPIRGLTDDCQHNEGMNWKSTCRYHSLNRVSIQTHGSIEIRLHSGTTNVTKIKYWITFLLNLVIWAKYASERKLELLNKLVTKKELHKYLLHFLCKTQNDLDYWIKRYKKFNGGRYYV